MMRPRKQLSEFKLRMREELRARLEHQAALNGRSMNTEIVSRLKSSLFRQEQALQQDYLRKYRSFKKSDDKLMPNMQDE